MYVNIGYMNIRHYFNKNGIAQGIKTNLKILHFQIFSEIVDAFLRNFLHIFEPSEYVPKIFQNCEKGAQFEMAIR